MINPTEKDIGRNVVYQSSHWSNREIKKEGIITNFNETMVFVKYEPNTQPKATLRSDLTWLRETKIIKT